MNDTVALYAPTITKTSDGIPKRTWAYKTTGGLPNDTVILDVQPAVLTQAQLTQWGYSTLPSDPKKCYTTDYNKNSPNTYLALGNRAIVNGGQVYDIRGLNVWESHTSCYFIPVQGE